jgi:glucan phosphoethanolaminetransferase (alkaline phosphatase superfamily)
VVGGDGRGRAILGMVLRSAATVVVLLVVYYQAPLDRPLDAATGLVFMAALVLFAAFVAFEVRGILGSPRPRLRAIRALVLGVPLLLVVFAATYCTIDAQQPGAFTEPLSRSDGLYFTMTVFSTVGFGDIAPASQLARVLVTVQMVVGLVAVGLIAKVVFGAVQLAEGRRRRSAEFAGLRPGDEL